MRKFLQSLVFIITAIAAHAQDPAVTMTTTTTIGSTFSFYIGATADNTPIQVDWGNGTLVSYTIGSWSTIYATPAGKTIKIYGEGIDYLVFFSQNITSLDVTKSTTLTKLECRSNQLTSLDVTKNTALTYLDCSSNQLTALDVTKNTALTRLSCSSNQLTVLDVSKNTALNYFECKSNQLTALDVTKNTALTDLRCTSNQLTALDVTNNTALTDLWCKSNKLTALNVTNNTALISLYCDHNQLTALNVTSNTALTGLVCSSNQLTALDLTKNTALYYFDCSSNQLTALDVTKNTALNYFECYLNQLTALDVTKNTELTALWCKSNKLTALDMTNNTALISLYCDHNQLTALNVTSNSALTGLACSYNQLTALDVTKNTALTRLCCENNKFLLSTLPVKKQGWVTYTYSPQNTINLTQKQYGLTETVDLSSELTVDGKTTIYIWKTKGGTTLVAGTDFNVANGITTFLKVQTDSVYCQMTNATFPDLTLTTTNIKVSQFPLSVTQNEVAVKVYPNPASDNFSVEMAEEIVRVEVYTITGVKVFENGLYNSTKVNVPITNMPKGTLIVRTYTRKGVYESKVIKI